MIEFIILVAVLVFIVLAIYAKIKLMIVNIDKEIDKFEPLSDYELLLLSEFDDKYYVDVLTYVRTLQMSDALQSHLNANKDALVVISEYMALQITREQIQKKKQWEDDWRSGNIKSQNPYLTKLINDRLKK